MELITTAEGWKEEFGEAGKNFLDVYSDGIKFSYYKTLGFDTMEDCTKSISIEFGWSKSVAATLAVEALPELEAEARERQGNRNDLDDNLGVILPQGEKSNDKAGQMFGVSGKYVKDAKSLKADNPELFEQVKNGSKSLQDAKKDQETITLKKTHVVQNFYTVEAWEKLDGGLKSALIGKGGNSIFNATNENIEWAKYSWNPITGCQHNCAYCYARDIANRFYPQKFETSFYPDRLNAPQNTKRKDLEQFENPVDKLGYRNVFVCSMADLFGKWVPAEWIEATLKTITDNPQWTFLLLTKFPIRMAEFDYPENVWLGTSVDYQWAVERAEKAFIKIKDSGFSGTCWLSCEPMMEQLTFNSLSMFDWVVMGGASRSTQTPEYKPPFDDIVHLYNQARQSNCKIYQKTNLIPGMSNDQRIREYPFNGEDNATVA